MAHGPRQARCTWGRHRHAHYRVSTPPPPPRGEATWVSPRHNQPLAPQTTPAKEGSLENTAVSDFHYWWELVEAPSVSFAVEPPHRK